MTGTSNGHAQNGHIVGPKLDGPTSQQNGIIAQSTTSTNKKGGGKSRTKRLAEIHSQRLPIVTKTLPTFIPHNPLSIFHILWTIMSEYIQPYGSHPSRKYPCQFSPHTRSIHVTDQATIRALWEKGFFGKGSLSRSEPNWLEAETKRLSSTDGNTAEEWTRKRRAERAAMKMERARIELQQIEEQKKIEQGVIDTEPVASEEATRSVETAENHPSINSNPIRPLPASDEQKPKAQLHNNAPQATIETDATTIGIWNAARVPLCFVNTISEGTDERDLSQPAKKPSGASIEWNPARIPLDHSRDSNEAGLPWIGNGEDTEQISIPAMVDPKQALTIVDDAPILPEDAPIVQEHILANAPTALAKAAEDPTPVANGAVSSHQPQFAVIQPPSPKVPSDGSQIAPPKITNQEHLQLSLEEAFFLQYSLDILDISFPTSVIEVPKTNADLLHLFRRHSTFPPAPSGASLEPDDAFMLRYVVYHHFRSLGWVVRDGVKFAVDYLLYERGPAFKHAEFAIQIIPSYSHTYWNENADRRQKVEKARQKHAWHWFHCVNRVQTHVTKTLVLCYVDVPPPCAGVGEGLERDETDIGKLLKGYKVREFCIRRWSANRNRG